MHSAAGADMFGSFVAAGLGASCFRNFPASNSLLLRDWSVPPTNGPSQRTSAGSGETMDSWGFMNSQIP